MARGDFELPPSVWGDVACLLHIPIDGIHMTITRDEAVEWMEEHLGSDPGEALIKVEKTKGAHCQLGYLQKIF